MLKRHEIQVLLKAGHSQVEVARLAGVSLRSIKRVTQEAAVEHVDDAGERRQRGIGRPSITEDFRKIVTEVLAEDPALKTVEILRRARLAGYTGRKSALYALVAALRPKTINPLVRFEGLPGEFSQHDFGQVDLEYRDGTIRRVRFFASRLKYSRTIRVSRVGDQVVETLIRTLADHLHDWGGAPLVCVFDRPKTVALEWQRDGTITEWNPTFAYAALERHRCRGLLALPAAGEGLGREPRRFRQGLVLQAAPLPRRRGLDGRSSSGTARSTRSVPAVPPVSRPPSGWPRSCRDCDCWKVAPQDLALRVPIYVGPTETVVHDTHPYSICPPAGEFDGRYWARTSDPQLVDTAGHAS